jgi:predicted metal-binding membrane protein
MMVVMFAVGVMNVIWMAALGMVMTFEKIGTGKHFTYVVGGALIVSGIAFVVSAIVAHWPVHAI